ncbi:hypothetical protein OE88DRAFT_1757165 [Heliocybe sulcata]|uniref:Ribosomal RNA methyltransferase FtsJ domain-containing protein n=1 Tax=Heliocybe sulcata TaxID=5364 RepID=A0A5C3MZ08_9AGAM|nr:hypothetical protein OE88DRAFT_1757165 [Heliocybe sulcata]
MKSGRLTEAILTRGCPELQRLHELRAVGWQDEKLDHEFVKQRQVADSADGQLSLTWYKRMSQVMQEIDDYTQCCPGGFTSYVLRKNRYAKGVGVSLPAQEGGHALLLDYSLRSRLDLYSADVTGYQLGPYLIDHPRLSPIPLQLRFTSFGHAFLDGHQLRTQVSDYGAPWDIHRLLLSQLILALRIIRGGGSMVVKLSHPERVLTAQILYMLDILSEKLVIYKPGSMHATRGTFYAVAIGVGNGLEGVRLPQMLRGLQDLWVETTFGGELGQGRYMTPSDLNFAITVEDLEQTYLDRLIELGRNVWDVQAHALHRWFQKKGVI